MTNRALLSVVAFDLTSTDGNIEVMPGAAVTVYEEDGTTLLAQAMYATNVSVVPLANPLTANNLGVATAYAVTPQNCVVKVGTVSYPAQFFQNMGDVLTVPTPLPLTQKTPSTVAAPGSGLDSIYPLTTGVWAHRANGGTEKTFVETAASQTLTNKTLTSPVITGGSATSTTLTTTAVSDTLSLPDGLVGTPSLFRTGDTNTGQWFPGADQIAWAVAGVEVARLRSFTADPTKPGTLEAKVRDKGGFVANLEAFAGGVTINNYAADGSGGDAASAWIAAVAYLVGVGGGILEVGAGTFAAPTAGVTWVDNIQVRGTYGKSIVLKRPSSSQPVFQALSVVKFGLTGLIIDGNLAQNLTLAPGNAEVVITGTDNYVIGNIVRDFNEFGIQVVGSRIRVTDNQIYINNGDGAASYAALVDQTSPGYQGYVGIATPGGGTRPCTDIEVSRNMVAGLRGPGIFVGGIGGRIDGNIVRNCHRYYCLTTGNAQTGGGVISLSPTATSGGGTQAPQDWVISNNVVEPPPPADVVTFGVWNHGIELNTCSDVSASGNVLSPSGLGISLDTTTDVKITGGTISRTHATGAGFRVAANTGDFGVSHVNFHANVGPAVLMSGTSDNYSIQGCHFKGNTTNWSNTASGANISVTGNITVDGDLVPEITEKSATGAYVAQFVNTHGSGFGVAINAAAPVLSLSTSVTSAAVRTILTLQEAGVTKGYIGLDASDSMCFVNTSGVASLTIDDAGGLTVLGGPWIDFVPTMTQNGANILFTKNLAHYRILGKTAHIQVKLTYSSGATGAAAILVVFPAPLNSKTTLVSGIGQFVVFDSSAVKYYSGWPQINGTTTPSVQGIQNNDGSAIGASPAFQLAAGDEVYLSMVMELA